MGRIHLGILTENEISDIHEATLSMLERTGVKVLHDEILDLLGQARAKVDCQTEIARLHESLVMESIGNATKQHTLHSHNHDKTSRFGFSDQVLMSSPGQYSWIDPESGERRAVRMRDFEFAGALSAAVLLGTVSVHMFGRRLIWDGENFKITNVPEANRYLDHKYRIGWSL